MKEGVYRGGPRTFLPAGAHGAPAPAWRSECQSGVGPDDRGSSAAGTPRAGRRALALARKQARPRALRSARSEAAAAAARMPVSS